MEKETIILDFRVDGKEAIVSIENLTKANKELREERKKLDLQSEEGLARARELNTQIDNNTNIIKANSSALEKQRLNVGNYKDSIKDAAKEINIAGVSVSSLSAKFELLSKNPLLLVITALGLAFSALTAYFKGSEEGQDKLAKITAILNVAMEKLRVVVEYVGEAIYNAITGTESMTEKLGIFGVALDIALTPLKLLWEGLKLIGEYTGFNKLVEETVKAGEAIADLYDKIEARENELVVIRAETSAKVLALREKAIKQEGAAKRATIHEAIDLEKALAAEEKKNLDDKLKAFDLEAAATGALTEEQKAKRAELVAAIIDAESQGAQATIKFQKEIERLREAEEKLKEEARQRDRDAEAFKDSVAQRDIERLQQRVDATKAANDGIIDLNEKLNIQLDEERVELDAKEEKSLNAAIARARLRLEWQNRTEREKLGITSSYIGQASSLFKKESQEYKALATVRALIDTYAAANAAFKLGGGFPTGAVFAAISIATGLANVAQIQGFKQGGYTGDMDTNQIAGVTHGKEFVMPASVVSQFGKDHFQSYMDGSIVANSMAASGGGQSQTPTVYLSYKEFSDFQDRVKYKEEMSAA